MKNEVQNPASSQTAVSGSVFHNLINMRNQCQCKLPYVHSGTDTCTQCRNQQTRFLPLAEEKTITQKKIFKGDEFKKGDIAEIIGKSYACLVEIQNYIPNGWYRVQLPNGGFHETQILGAKVS